MAAPTSYAQTEEWLTEINRKAQDIINVLKGGIDVGQSGTLGNLALINALSDAPIGNLATLQQRLQVQNVAGRATVGSGPRIMMEGAHGIGGYALSIQDATGVNDIATGVVSFIPSYASFAGAFVTASWANSQGWEAGIVTSGGGRARGSWRFRDWNGSTTAWQPWRMSWDTVNTTVDSNGFIKSASPILRLSNHSADAVNEDLNFEEAGAGAVNGEAQGVTATRDDVGVYTISGSLGFATSGWTIEVPQCINGNRMVFVETEQSDDGTITVRTFKPGTDEPMDIPDGRWIDLRLSMPEPPSDEYPEDEPAPELTPEQQEQRRLEQLERWRNSATITPRQARLVLSRHGLLSGVAAAIAGIEDDQEREIVEIEWEYANSIERSSEWVNTLYAALGLSQEDVDSLFLEAAQI
ncbi:hypothetical protein [Vreelandella populi]|uniref:phage tail fiber protein n=1 Tax=Vreelandella populi TaxID=2498858 RepID=UPI000F8E64F3|nr:hypothetical protein [Halomonas populi]RUR38570.1 hypothetical protein ELY25_09415 [Halomonas populi]